MLELPYIQTNVFTDENYLFSGNQLATFYDAKANMRLTDEQMLELAREINFSETTFVLPPTRNNCIKKVRIFTPDGELPFAGHPTLGTSFVLRYTNQIPENVSTITLELNVGPIKVDFEDKLIIMTQPKPEFFTEFKNTDILIEALGLKSTDLHKEYPVQIVSTGNGFLMVPLKSLQIVQKLQSERKKLAIALEGYPSIGLYVFTTETVHKTNQIHARMISPRDSLLEDPATGSAAGPLTAYLEKYEVLNNHKRGDLIIIEQGYEMHRPSRLIAGIKEKNNIITSVNVKGAVKLTLKGIYYL